MTFQSENLITGMYQRLDKLNKNAFASVGLFGKSRNSQIQGVWIWRGSELAFKLSDNWQVGIEYKRDGGTVFHHASPTS